MPVQKPSLVRYLAIVHYEWQESYFLAVTEKDFALIEKKAAEAMTEIQARIGEIERNEGEKHDKRGQSKKSKKGSFRELVALEEAINDMAAISLCPLFSQSA